jgi:hypothetical protein
MNTFLLRSAIATSIILTLCTAQAATPPSTTATTRLERKLEHQLNKHVAFPLNGDERMDGVVLVSFVVDIEGHLKVVDAEGTNPQLRDYVVRQMEKVDIGDNPTGTWKIERRRFVFRPEA